MLTCRTSDFSVTYHLQIPLAEGAQKICSYCASSDIFYPITFYAAAASSEAPIFCDTWQFNHDGRDKRELQEMPDVELPVYPGNSSKQPLLLPENVAQKKLPLIERSMAFQRVNMGQIYGRRHLQMFSHPSGVSFSSPLLLSFLSVGFVWLEHLLTHILPILTDLYQSSCRSFSMIPFTAFPSWLLLCKIRVFWMLKILCDGACSVLLPTSSETTNVIWEMSAICWHQSLAAGIAVNRDINRMPVVMGEDTRAVLSPPTCGPLNQYFQQPS